MTWEVVLDKGDVEVKSGSPLARRVAGVARRLPGWRIAGLTWATTKSGKGYIAYIERKKPFCFIAPCAQPTLATAIREAVRRAQEHDLSGRAVMDYGKLIAGLRQGSWFTLQEIRDLTTEAADAIEALTRTPTVMVAHLSDDDLAALKNESLKPGGFVVIDDTLASLKREVLEAISEAGEDAIALRSFVESGCDNAEFNADLAERLERVAALHARLSSADGEKE